MNKSEDKRLSARPASYRIWVTVFWIFVCLMAGAFYYATQKIEYVWRWHRVPIYFAYEDTIDITSDIDGDVESITQRGDEAVIRVQEIDATES